MSNTHIKIQVLLLLFFSCILPCSAWTPDELKVGLKEWNNLKQEQRVQFLQKCQTKSKELIHLGPVTTKQKLKLENKDFVQLIKNIDDLYKLEENKHVTIWGAVAIEVMRLNKCPANETLQKLESEQTRIMWGF
jgi:hypothetical protein